MPRSAAESPSSFLIHHSTLDEIPSLLRAATIGVWLFALVAWLSPAGVSNFGQLVAFWLLAAALLPTLRGVVRWEFRRDRDFPQNTVIVGAGSVGQLLGRKFLQHPEYRVNLLGFLDAAPRDRPFWPVWVLVAATVFLFGFRVGLNLEASNVIDVGYAGVIGAQRIVDQGEMPYGHMPVREGEACGDPDAYGDIRDRMQTNGRCETANDRGDTYGPVTYIAYIPGYLISGWSGKWDDLPAAHVSSLFFDVRVLTFWLSRS